MSRTYDIALAGATGLVGEALLQILEERAFPVGRLYPLASERSVGRTVAFRGEEIPVEAAHEFDFSRVQLGLFSAGASVSREIVPRAVAAGAVAASKPLETSCSTVTPSPPWLRSSPR